jgi:ABC-type arginine/histidine transport system permease subunit
VQVSNEHLLAKTERASSLVFTSVLALRYAFARARVDSLTLHLAEADPLVNLTFDSTPLLVHELALYVGGGFMF